MKSKILGAFVVLAVVSAIVYYSLQSEQRKIRKQFVALTESISKEQDEGNSALAIKMMTLVNLLCDEVCVDINDFPFGTQFSSEELVSLATRGRTQFSVIKISLLDIETEILSENTARSAAAVKVYITSKGINRNYDEIRNVTAKLQKIDKKWKFSSFEETIQETIKK